MKQIEVPDLPRKDAGAPIIVALDSSDSSRHALEEAVRIANFTGAPVYAVNYVYDEEMETFNRWLPEHQSDLLAGRKTCLQRWLDELDLPSGGLEVRVSVGHPLSELMALVEEIKPGMLVVGMHGNHDKSGSHSTEYFSRACLRHGPSEVLLVRDYDSGPFKEIIAAIDFSETSWRVVREAASMARAEKCDLKVVHIFSPNWEYFGSRDAIASEVEAYFIGLKEQFEDLIDDDLWDFPEVHISFEVREDVGAAEGIISYAAEVGADLIVIGLVGRGPSHRPLPGSTAEEVLCMSDCSVLAVSPSVNGVLDVDC